MMIKGVVRLILGGNMKLKRLAALVLTGALCLTTLFGCGSDAVSAEETIATLGEETVSYGVANFLVKYQKSSFPSSSPTTAQTLFEADDQN